MRLLLLAAAVVLATGPMASADPHARAAQVRTVYIGTSTRALPNSAFVRLRDCVRRPRSCVNGIGGRELVYLTKGKLPGATTATVLTDTNCDADGNGISHC